MRRIDTENWARRDHFNFFSTFDQPHFNMCANMDLTTFYPAVKQRDLSFTVAFVYGLARVANAIPEFRQRIRPGMVIEHEVVHPAITVLTEDDLFSFCMMYYAEDFAAFSATAAEQMACARTIPSLDDGPEPDSLLYMTAIPWVSFTSFMHPIHMHPVDSVPRFAWGKFFKDGQRTLIPLGVQGHHALMDGLHMGRYYEQVQGFLDDPGAFLD